MSTELRKSHRKFVNTLMKMLLVDGMSTTVRSFVMELIDSEQGEIPFPDIAQMQADMVELSWESLNHFLAVEFWDNAEYDFTFYHRGRENSGNEVEIEGAQGTDPLKPYLAYFRIGREQETPSSKRTWSELQDLYKMFKEQDIRSEHLTEVQRAHLLGILKVLRYIFEGEVDWVMIDDLS